MRDGSSAGGLQPPSLRKTVSPAWSKNRGCLHLGTVHFASVLLLASVVALGSFFFDSKWTTLSPRLYRVRVKQLRPNGEPVSVDVAFAQKAFFTHFDGNQSLARAFEAHDFATIFIPPGEKHMYRERRRLEGRRDADLPLDFSSALICSPLLIGPSANDHMGAEESCPRLPVTYDFFSAEGAKSFTPRLTTLNSDAYDIFTSSARTCALWRKSGASPGGRRSIPRLIKASGGLLAPNYVGRGMVEFLVRNPLANVAAVLLAWSHSVALPQPVSVVHAPRLLCYGVLALWRAGGLYVGLGLVERVPFIQSALREMDEVVRQKVSSQGSRSSHEPFDFSDHIVLISFLIFVLSTELFCVFHFRRPDPRRSGSGTDAEQDSGSDQLLPSNSPGIIDNPFEVPRPGVYILLGTISVFIVILLYGCLVTAAFHHSPLEVIVALIVAILGLYGLFWLLVVILDWGFTRQYFGLA